VRYAIVSDIHANLEALRAVLKDIKAQRVDKIICLYNDLSFSLSIYKPPICIKLKRSQGRFS
jgi:predicted phosphodiesterase